MRKLFVLLSIFLIIILCFFLSFKEKTLNIDDIDLVSSKDALMENEFDSKYKFSVKTNINSELEKKIKELSIKSTYLLLGEYDEVSEEYYKRHDEFNKLIYSSNDDIDSYVADESCKYMFNRLNEYDIKYNSIGDIRVIESKNFIISTVVLPDIILKVEDSNDSYKYVKKTSNLIINYYFKKDKDNYKIFYISSDLKNDLYSSDVSFAIKGSSNSQLFNTKDLVNINNNVYDRNKDNIFKLTSYKINEEVDSSIGILLKDNLLLTSYKFIEKSLMDGDFISIKNSDNKNINYDGFVTLNKEYNYAVIRLKNSYLSTTIIGNVPSVEEAILEVENVDNEIIISKDIVIGNSNNIKTNKDNYNDSIIFDKSSRLVGLSVNDEFISSKILFKLQYLLDNNKNNVILTFDYLKNKYFMNEDKYTDNNVVLPSELLKYDIVRSIDKNINIPLVNYSMEDNNISLKYKNNISDYMSSMNIFNTIKDNFKGYKRVVNANNKQVYENDKYRVIATTEFDYLIIVVVIK